MVRAISDSNNESRSNRDISFTPDSATRMLPLVRRIVDDMLKLTTSIEAQREQLREIDNLPQTSDQPDYREELSDVRGSLERDEQRLDACLGELSTLGLQPHVPIDGSVDFPAIRNRRRVVLCWRPGEAEVGHWHEIGRINERKPLSS